MKRMRILGLALVAVFALAAVAASGASAAPTFFECAKTAKNATTKKYEAKYTDKLCSAESPTKEGKYELKEGIGKGKVLKGKAGGVSRLHTFIPGKGDIPVECAKAKDVAQPVLPNKITKAVTVFSKCKAAGAPCQNGKKETITTAPLEGELGYISASPLKVGVKLKPEGTTYFAEFECTGVAGVRTFGEVIGEQSGDINTVSKESELSFTTQEKNYGFGPSIVNNPTHFEGESGEHILLTELNPGTGFEPAGGLPSGQEGSIENKGEALEVKA
jgi:hypothetical protein